MSLSHHNTTVMTIKTNKALKQKAQELAKDMGFPLGTLINAFLRQFVRDEAVSFSLIPQTPYVMNKKLEKELAEIEGDLKQGQNISLPFENAEGLIHYLHKAEVE